MLRFRWEAAEHVGEGGRGVSVAAHNIEVFGAFTVSLISHHSRFLHGA